ncbi:hypothetical protein J4219_04240 [Candidatus Woesearchaeota archaeon]|nr:hypothetical protein [Candidatus Woesearchaeota archaeon]
MNSPYVTANLTMRVLGDHLPCPYLLYTLDVTEGRCEEKLKLDAFKTITQSARDSILDHKSERWRPVKNLYHSLKDILPLYLSMSDQPLLQPFAQSQLLIPKDNRALHPVDELRTLQMILDELSSRDPTYFNASTQPLIQNIGDRPIDPRVYRFLRKAYRELTPSGNIYKPTSQNPSHGEEEKGGRSSHERKRPA